jgi:predicted acyl esterase
MFGLDWATSAREFDVSTERDVVIPLPDGNSLVGDVYRPLTDAPVPLVTLHHSDRYPSVLCVPVTGGNVLGTFLSGGALPATVGPVSYAKIQRQKGT